MFYRMHTARPNGFAMQPTTRRLIAGWPMTAAAAAVAAVMAFGAVDANAMALGRIKVLSTLGEPLRAEIDIAEITTAEAESLRVSPASPETFRAAGLEFDSVISSVRVAVQRRANGRPFLRLSSSRPVNDPFMDLILNVSSSSGGPRQCAGCDPAGRAKCGARRCGSGFSQSGAGGGCEHP